MSTSDQPSVAVDLRSSDPAVEISLLDYRLQPVAHGVGGLRTSVLPGVYKLKVQTGTAVQEELVLLRDASFSRDLTPVQFASPVPLDATTLTHEYHIQGAEAESAKTHVTLGQGSKLFVFARDWTPQEVASDSSHDPAEGLTLCSLSGETLVDFEKSSVRNLYEDPWAACAVALDPGRYRLGVKVADGVVFEQMVVAAPGWRTDVFLLQRISTGPVFGKHPDLAGASISMSGRPSFSSQDPTSRLTETARLALTNRRPIASGQLAEMLRGKFDDPMLGILGGHLILLGSDADQPLSPESLALLKEVVGNLRNLLTQPHADVEALALAAGLEPQGDFETPPMLRRSWQIVMDASGTRKNLTTAGSLTGKVATRITNQDPWLIWQRPPAPAAEQPVVEPADYAVAMVKLFTPADSPPVSPSRAQQLYQGVRQLFTNMVESTGRFIPAILKVRDVPLDVAYKALMSEKTMPALVKTLGVPRANVEEMITAAYHDFKKQGQVTSRSQT